MEVPKRKRLEIVQVSRAIAILFVLLGHANINFYQEVKYDWFNMASWERTGGVDFFFIVTGFMIYYIYHKHAGDKGKASQFLLKRVLRLLPLYWIFTALAVLFYYVTAGGYSMEVISRSFLLLPGEPILSSSWSLTYIMFFYILFAAYLYKPAVMKIIISLGIVITILAEVDVLPFLNPSFLSISVLEIFCGSLVAFISIRFTTRYANLFIAFGLAGYFFIWMNNLYSFTTIYFPLAYGLFSMMIMYGIAEKDKADRKVPRFWSYLGDASYSIYIAHGPFLHLYLFLMIKFNIMEVTGLFLGMVMTLILVTLSCCIVYTFLEKPLVDYLRRAIIFRKKATFPVPLSSFK